MGCCLVFYDLCYSYKFSIIFYLIHVWSWTDPFECSVFTQRDRTQDPDLKSTHKPWMQHPFLFSLFLFTFLALFVSFIFWRCCSTSQLLSADPFLITCNDNGPISMELVLLISLLFSFVCSRSSVSTQAHTGTKSATIWFRPTLQMTLQKITYFEWVLRLSEFPEIRRPDWLMTSSWLKSLETFVESFKKRGCFD